VGRQTVGCLQTSAKRYAGKPDRPPFQPGNVYPLTPILRTAAPSNPTRCLPIGEYAGQVASDEERLYDYFSQANGTANINRAAETTPVKLPWYGCAAR